MLRKKEIRRETKARILAGVDKNELVHFVFSKNETQTKLRWEHDREFEFQGEMYDIVQLEDRGDSTAYWCIWDKAETQLNRQLATLTAIAANADPPSQTAVQHLLHFWKSLFLQAEKLQPGLPPGYVLSTYCYTPHPGRQSAAPPAPPPEARSSTMEYL